MLAFHISTQSVKIHTLWPIKFFPQDFTEQFQLAFTPEFNGFGIAIPISLCLMKELITHDLGCIPVSSEQFNC